MSSVAATLDGKAIAIKKDQLGRWVYDILGGLSNGDLYV